MRLLIDHGADVKARDDTGSTPLHMASASGIPELVQLLIEHGADVRGQDRSNRTPLHLASSRVSAKTPLLLILLKADINGMGRRSGQSVLRITPWMLTQ